MKEEKYISLIIFYRNYSSRWPDMIMECNIYYLFASGSRANKKVDKNPRINCSFPKTMLPSLISMFYDTFIGIPFLPGTEYSISKELIDATAIDEHIFIPFFVKFVSKIFFVFKSIGEEMFLKSWWR